MNKVIIAIIILAVLLALGAFAWYQMNTTAVAPAENNQPAQQETLQESPLVDVQIDTTPVAKTFEVTYTGAGYSPSTLTIKTGDTVTFKNKSIGNLWTASGMHPAHMGYSGTNLQAHCPDAENNDFDQCQNGGPGTSWSFTFTKAGAWGYHNHANSTHFGKITVE